MIISVDSLETPLKDIEFPALTLCPNFEPDYTALAEELFNQFEFNCDVGDEDCDQIRESFVGQLDQTYQDVQSKVNNLKFETVYTATVDGKAPNLSGKFLALTSYHLDSILDEICGSKTIYYSKVPKIVQ